MMKKLLLLVGVIFITNVVFADEEIDYLLYDYKNPLQN